MHYSGMSAISIAGYIRWDPMLVIASIAAARSVRHGGNVGLQGERLDIAGRRLAHGGDLHATFYGHGCGNGGVRSDGHPHYPQIDNTLLATAIAGITLLVILSGLSAALINQDTARELRLRADHDHLTGLPNKGYISRMIDNSISSSAKSGFALFFIDLDRFKAINDDHGHIVGDHVLRQAAQRLRSAVCEPAIVARAGGDEFIVLHAGSEPRLAKGSLTRSFPPSSGRLNFRVAVVRHSASALASHCIRAMDMMENRFSELQTRLFIG